MPNSALDNMDEHIAPAMQAAAHIAGAGAADADQELWLLGQPPLWRYLEFAERALGEHDAPDRAALTREWCAANELYQALEHSEAGLANTGAHRELDTAREPAVAPLIAAVKAHPHYRHTFDTLPTHFAWVELDKLIVFQKHVTWTFIERLMARIGPAPSAAALFRLCLPLEAAKRPAVQICALDANRYVFRCESTDLRYHETTVLAPAQLPHYHSFGPLAGALGIVVGFGCEFLNAVRVGNRLLLHNGYHRACALRALGVRHAPCIVQTARCADEIHAAVKGRIAEDAQFYFESARPPLLKDFFDARLRKFLRLRRQVHLVEVSVQIRHLAETPLTPA